MLERPVIFKINEGNGPDLLLQVFLERGWREHSDEGLIKDNWHIWWRTTTLITAQWKALKDWQFVNHVPKASCICRKDYLCRYLRVMKGTFGGIYDFSPDAYNLPLDYNKLVEKCSQSAYDLDKDIWICKPVGQSQGRGISIFKKMSDLEYGTSSVVQRYVKNPFLIGGYKFDLRLYVCVPCFHPLTVYVYREGLARFSTDKFSLADLKNRYAHLTNCSLNKQGPGYAEMKERVGAGCKWSLKKLRYYLEHNRHDDWLMWQRIVTVIVLTIVSQINGIPSTKNCFEFYGFDVLIDSALKPWLLEVNSSPALCADCDVDPAIKKPMLHDLLDLLGLPVCYTGLSLLSDWAGPTSEEEEPESSCDEEGYKALRKTQMAVNVVTMANKWKRQLKPSSQNVAYKDRRGAKGSQACKGEKMTSGIRSAPPRLKTGNPSLCKTTKPNLKKKDWPKCRWDNGRDWRQPSPGEGDWVRVYPFYKKHVPYRTEQEEKQNPVTGDKEIRNIVSNVIKYYKMAREIFAKTPKYSDEERDFALLEVPGLSDAVWHPYR